jgi:hypothetical protein
MINKDIWSIHQEKIIREKELVEIIRNCKNMILLINNI